jgi:hypothetical protein
MSRKRVSNMDENLGNQLMQLRESADCDFDALAAAMNVDAEDIETWERNPESAVEQLELRQWVAWAEALHLPLIEMLAQAGLCAKGAVHPITFRELRDRIGELSARLGGLHCAEDLTGWELGEFVRNPEVSFKASQRSSAKIGEALWPLMEPPFKTPAGSRTPPQRQRDEPLPIATRKIFDVAAGFDIGLEMPLGITFVS